ncbi:hypothetical protein MTR67_022976, partial [Solanum verrucosum]
FNGHGRPQFRQKFYVQGSSNAPALKFNRDGVSNPKPQGGHKIRDCMLLTTKGRDGRQAHASGSGLGLPRQNKFYAF